IENSISGAYNFDPFHSLTLSFRNFWTTVTYDRNPFFLQEDGSLLESPMTFEELGLSSSNVNFNTWNLDFRYSWQFAPGSFLTALYRNSLFNQSELSQEGYFRSLGDLFDQDMTHIFSLRLQYFIDYNNIKGLFRKKTSS
ncbi:MAG: protein with DOMON-like ligand-binding domain protein, partial [Flavobacteriaceae bacterium]|nr:protein with DOMON-like ligand-binding domain protein [Flavobacteriaceae bacterium]